MHRFARVVASAVLVALLGTFAVSAPASAQEQTIAEIAVATPDLSTTVWALGLAAENGHPELLDALVNPAAGITVFAPTNAAWNTTYTDDMTFYDAAMADPAGVLAELLAYHVVGAEKTAANLIVQRTAKTLQGGTVSISLRDGTYYVDNAKLTAVDIAASNGVVHVIDKVLVPMVDAPTPNQQGTFAAPSVGHTSTAAAATAAGISPATAPVIAAAATTPASTAASAEPVALANTGQESLPLFVIAALLMMFGAVVLMARDRYEFAVVAARVGKPVQLQPFSWPEVPAAPEARSARSHSTFADELSRTQVDSDRS